VDAVQARHHEVQGEEHVRALRQHVPVVRELLQVRLEVVPGQQPVVELVLVLEELHHEEDERADRA
jgi:hypothetical protein